MSGPLSAPFNRRVRVLVEVADDDGEEALVRDLCGAEGWPVAPAPSFVSAPFAPRRRGLVVEVRLEGARRGACKAAERHLRFLADRAKAAMWVRQSVLVEPTPERRTRYEVRLRPPEGGGRPARWFLRIARRCGGTQGRRSITRPGAPDGFAALTELGQRSLSGGRPYDPARDVLHGPSESAGDGEDSADETRPETATANGYLSFGFSVAVTMGAMMLGMACGGVAQRWHSPGRWAVIAVALLLSVPMGRRFNGYVSGRLAQLGAGAVAIALSVGLGWMLLLVIPVSSGDLPVALSASLLGGGVAVWTARGVSKAVAHSWFSRNANWLLPAFVVPLPLGLVWFGKMLFTLYLDYGFGVPADEVPLPQFSLLFVGLKPVSVAAGCGLFFLAVAGWGRYTYQGRTSGAGTPTFLLPLVTLQFMITALGAGLIGVADAAADASQAARQGKQPAAYFGLDPTLMCVRPLAKRISVYNGPLATDRPVLTFGSTDDRIWLWGPHGGAAEGSERRYAMSVRLEDVALVAAPKSGC